MADENTTQEDAPENTGANTLEEQAQSDFEFDEAFAEDEKTKPKATAPEGDTGSADTGDTGVAADEDEIGDTGTAGGDTGVEADTGVAGDTGTAGDQETAVERMERLATEAAAKPDAVAQAKVTADALATKEAIEAEVQKRLAAAQAKAEADTAAEKAAKAATIDENYVANRIANMDGDLKAKADVLLTEIPELQDILQDLFSGMPTAQPVAEAKTGVADAVADPEAAVELGRLRLLHACELKHPGSTKIADSPEFETWVGKQSAAIQALTEGGNVDSCVTIIQAYQETTAKTAAEVVDDKVAAAKEKADALHKSTAKPKGAKKAPDKAKGDKDDFGAGFDDESSDEEE